MLFSRISPFFLLVFSFLMASGCKRETANLPKDALAYVPATASMVTAINLKKLLQKADFESIKKMEFYQDMLADAESNPNISRLMANPELSGIDLDQNVYLTTDINKDNPEEITTYLLFSLKNAEDFNRLFASDAQKIANQEGIKLAGNGTNSMLGWSDKLAVFALNNHAGSDLTEKIILIFKNTPEKSLAKNENLVKAISNGHDIASWMSTDQMAENEAAGMALDLIDLEPEALKGNHIHSYGDFENGRMVAHSEFFINKKLGENFIGRFFKKGVTTDFSNLLPADHLAFAMTGAMDIRGIDQFLSERPQTKDYADFVLNDLGMKRKDLMEVFGGDLLAAIYSTPQMSSEPSLLVATGLKNKKKAQDFIDTAEKQGKLKKIESGYYKVVSIGNEDFSITRSKGMGRLLFIEDKLVFSINIELLEKIKARKFEKAAKNNWQNAANQTFSAWINGSSMMNFWGGMEGNFVKEANFNINGKGADFILETNEPDVNSLHTMMKMMNEAYKQRLNGRQTPGEAM